MTMKDVTSWKGATACNTQLGEVRLEDAGRATDLGEET